MSPRNLLRVPLKYGWGILGFCLVAIAFVVGLTFAWPPTYESYSTILVKVRLAPAEGPAVFPRYAHVLRTISNEEVMNSEKEIITSRPVMERVVERLQLQRPYEEKEPSGLLGRIRRSMRSLITFLMDLPSRVLIALGISDPPTDEVLRDVTATSLAESLDVMQVPDSNVLKISLRGWYPDRLASTIEAVSDEYIRHHLVVHQSTDATRFFEDQLEAANSELIRVEAKYRDFKEEEGMISYGKAELLLFDKTTELEAGILDVEEDVIEQRARVHAMRQARLEDPTLVVPALEIREDPALQLLSSKIFDARVDLELAAEKYTASHPEVVRARKQLDERETSYREEANKIVALEESKLLRLEAQLAELRASLAGIEAEVAIMPQRMFVWDQLERSIDHQRSVTRGLVEKYQDAKLESVEDRRLVNVNLISPATTPVLPASPNKLLNIVLVVVLAPVLAVTLAYFLDSVDRSLRDPEDVQERCGLPMLGYFLEWPRGKEPSTSALAEPYKRVVNGVFAQDPSTRSLVVAACHEGEGARTVAAGLARSLARLWGRKVLYVDAVAASGAEADAAADPTFQREDEGLELYTLDGPGPLGSLDLAWNRDRLRSFLDDVERRFDHVIIAGPPLVRSEMSSRLTSEASGLVLVVQAEQTRAEVLSRMMESVTAVGGRVFGVVLNRRRFYIPEFIYRRL